MCGCFFWGTYQVRQGLDRAIAADMRPSKLPTDVKDTKITTMINMRLSLFEGPMSPYLHTKEQRIRNESIKVNSNASYAFSKKW